MSELIKVEALGVASVVAEAQQRLVKMNEDYQAEFIIEGRLAGCE